MSQFIAPTFKDEAGNQFAVATPGNIITDCDGGIEGVLKKKFHEVFISWDGSQWNEDPVYVPGSSVVALKIINQCNDTFAYIRYGAENFRLKQICCVNCPVPLTAGALPQATLAVAYNATLQIQGNGDYQLNVVAKPDWMTITLNPANGQITLSGTPIDPEDVGDVVVQLEAANCGDDIMIDPVEYTLNVQQVLTFFTGSPISTQPWTDIKFVPFLNKWVAITQSGTINRIATSPDLSVFTLMYSSTVQFNRICVGNNKIVIVGSGDVGAVVTSVDGTTWNPFTVPEVMQSFGVAYSPTLDLYVLTNQLGTNKLMKSSDGEVWTAVTAPVLNNHRNICWSTALELFVAVATNGTGNQVITSPDGDTWTVQTTPTPARFWDDICETTTGRLIAVSTSGASGLRIMYSDDAVTWNMAGAIPNPNLALQSISVAPGIVVAAGTNAFSGTASFVKSIDNGLTWQQASTDDGQWSGLDYGNDIFAAVGIGAGGSNSVLEVGIWYS
jgi:hypothetical protein